MDFIHEESIVLGTCYDLSQSGLRGRFVQAIPRGSKGIVTLYSGEQRFEVEATVSSVREDETQMRFHFESNKERAAMLQFLKEIGACSHK